MAITINKSYIITDEETGERISLEVLGNGNIKLDIKGENNEIKPDTFEELVNIAKELVQ